MTMHPQWSQRGAIAWIAHSKESKTCVVPPIVISIALSYSFPHISQRATRHQLLTPDSTVTGRYPSSAGADGSSRPRRLGLDDDPAGAVGEHRLDGLAEERRARARRQWQDDRLRADRARLVGDEPPALAGADLDDAPGDAPADEHPRVFDDRRRGGLALGQLGVQRRGLRHGDRH